MPKRTDIASILVIGAGPIVIGQACEFDYSGVQAIKALKAEGYRVVLVNSNPATIMTDPELADATYIEPITPEFVEKIIAAERPDALLPTMGGQTALNCALQLSEAGVLDRYGVEMIGAKPEAIEMAEDRKLFREAMERIGLENPVAEIIASPGDGQGGYDRLEGLRRAIEALDTVGLPAIIRPAFTLGGTGGGVAYNREEYEEICRAGLAASPRAQILVDESLLGWKEFEMEVVRDRNDNCIIICAIENIDPMGVHTGDSVTVAPALTLTDREYQVMRSASIAVLREIGVETGGSNVQFAVNPENGRLVVIEMNPRVSRSSALASKATGFPIAKVAAKLAVGYTLDELENDITGGAIPAAFEPTLDYVVTKMPRFAFEKYRGAVPELTTAMKSVGEAMAIGRNFAESFQKALCSLETGICGLEPMAFASEALLREALAKQTPDRLRVVADAFRAGLSEGEIHAVTRIDPWFLRQIEGLVREEARIAEHGLPGGAEADAAGWTALKQLGFSDKRLGQLAGERESRVRALRHAAGVRPVYKRIDTCAGEFEAATPYLYSTYETPAWGQSRPHCEAEPSDRRKAVILGGGPNRIGQGIEFDYCCCHAAFALAELGVESVMVNCNPETVSTDYDTSDRLYFEPLTAEHVLEILHVEGARGELLGVNVQFGGQTPLNLAAPLEAAGIPILGTAPASIALAEDREQFAALLDRLGLRQAPGSVARSAEEAREAAARTGYPVMLRPSFVLGGRAMEVAHDEADLLRYVNEAVRVSEGQPLLVDRYLASATEVDVDALCDGTTVHVAGVMEHIEEAGVHSGDSACALPPFSLSAGTVERLGEEAGRLALALEVKGLLNVQFAVKDGDIFVLEANPRASRTVPFVAKAVNAPVAGIAAKLMAGEALEGFDLEGARPRRMNIKEAVFPFARFPGTDPMLGPEMRSTGEVMGRDDTFGAAFLKSQIAAGVTLPTEGTVFVSVKDADKDAAVSAVRDLVAMGFSVTATGGTLERLQREGIPATRALKVNEGKPSIVDALKDGGIQLVFNTTEGARSVRDSASIRIATVSRGIPYFTTLAASVAAVEAIRARKGGPLSVSALQSEG